MRTASFFLVFVLLLGCVGCAGMQKKDPLRGIQAVCAAERMLPDGKLYCLREAVGTELLTESMLALLFGEGRLPPALDGVEDAALYLSYKHPCQFALFLCRGLRDTDAVAEMCLQRLATLRAEWSRAEGAGAWSDYLASATVHVRGRWVLLCISSDVDAALHALRSAL